MLIKLGWVAALCHNILAVTELFVLFVTFIFSALPLPDMLLLNLVPSTSDKLGWDPKWGSVLNIYQELTDLNA